MPTERATTTALPQASSDAASATTDRHPGHRSQNIGGGGGGGGRAWRAMGAGAGEGETAAAARLVLVAVLLHSLVQCAGANTETKARLTTGFGKPQQKPQENHPPKELLGVPCNEHKDCDILNTTCIEDVRDGKKRCLCGDRSVPKGAICRNKHRIVGFPCNADPECVENAECVFPGNISSNSTAARKMDVSKIAKGHNMKICWCPDPYELTEDHHCSNMGAAQLPSAVLLLASIYLLFMDVTVQNIKY